MVFTPTRGDAPTRFGSGVPLIPDIGTGILEASVYTDPEPNRVGASPRVGVKTIAVPSGGFSFIIT